jgi:hypothetical protein
VKRDRPERDHHLGKTTRTGKQTSCPSCGAPIDSGTGVGHNRKPRAGAICVCFKCGHLMAYAWDLTFRELTDEEMHAVAGHPTILKLQEALAWVKFAKALGLKPVKVKRDARPARGR